MTSTIKKLIDQDDWLGVAKAITFAYVNAPANPKKYAWVSAVEEGPYHIETNDSAANGGQGFKAICGVAGDFNFHLTAAQIFPSQKCKTCVEISQSSANILDSQSECSATADALNTGKGVSDASGRNSSGELTGCQVRFLGAHETTDSLIFDRHGDDRFADNILRALEGLPQNGDKEEEEDAAEEGALIEASGYPDPASDPRFA